MALPRGFVGWSAVCDCNTCIFWPYSPTFSSKCPYVIVAFLGLIIFSIFVSELFQDLSQMQETWLAEGKPLASVLGKGIQRY